jgi:hypothetical protein
MLQTVAPPLETWTFTSNPARSSSVSPLIDGSSNETQAL